MEQIKASEVPRCVPWLLDQAESGELVALYRRDRVVAVLVPIAIYDGAREAVGEMYWPEVPGAPGALQPTRRRSK